MTTHIAYKLEEIKNAVTLISKCGGVPVAGGAHATGDPYGTLKNLGFKVAVIGEAEETIVELVEALENGSLDVLENVKGIVVDYGSEILYTGKRKPINLDDYPPFPYWRSLYAPIEITRGCPWACRYCETWFIHGGFHRHRSVDTIRFYAELMVKKNLKDLRFITPNALGYGERERGKPNIDALDTLLEELNKLKYRYGGVRIFFGTFPSEMRPDYVSSETVKLLVGRIANKSVIIGAQSGSNRVLKMINRGHSVDDVVNAVKVLNEYGFSVDIDLILGIPFETDEDAYATLHLAKTLVERYKVRLHLHTFIPLPGTPMEGLKARKLPRNIEQEYYKFIGQGKAYGYWMKQAELSERISALYAQKVIYGLRGWRFIRVKS